MNRCDNIRLPPFQEGGYFFRVASENRDPHMTSSYQVSRIRDLIASFVFLSLFCAPAFADTKPAKKSKLEVEFGIKVAQKGLWREAIYRWQKAVELDPDNASARNNLAVAYEQEGDFELAEQEYKRALDIDPENVYIRQNYELFREAYEKRKRKQRKSTS
jgi:Tfp pilus assembly protein PilF